MMSSEKETVIESLLASSGMAQPCSLSEPDDKRNYVSYWYPKLLGGTQTDGIECPETRTFSAPPDVQKASLGCDSGMPRGEWNAILDKWIASSGMTDCVSLSRKFVKNGVFSNKFDFRYCIADSPSSLRESIVRINTAAMAVEAGGLGEISLRSVIHYEESKTPCIYGGLPLRSEFRCFYDFDSRRLIGCFNYWDFGACWKNIRWSASDRIIFSHEYPKLAARYLLHRGRVMRLADEFLKDKPFDGIWSVDFLLDESGKLWLIDMGDAARSAYREKIARYLSAHRQKEALL